MATIRTTTYLSRQALHTWQVTDRVLTLRLLENASRQTYHRTSFCKASRSPRRVQLGSLRCIFSLLVTHGSSDVASGRVRGPPLPPQISYSKRSSPLSSIAEGIHGCLPKMQLSLTASAPLFLSVDPAAVLPWARGGLVKSPPPLPPHRRKGVRNRRRTFSGMVGLADLSYLSLVCWGVLGQSWCALPGDPDLHPTETPTL